MKYSVYDPDRRLYTYYEGSGPRGTHAGSPRVRGKTALGAAPEQAAWPLPMGAVKVGEGKMPMGRIASRSELSLGSLGIDTDPVSLGIYGVLAYFAWRALR